MKKRKISMAEVAMKMKRTFVQPLDISLAITAEDLIRMNEECRIKGLDPAAVWDLFRAMNLGEAVFDGNIS